MNAFNDNLPPRAFKAEAPEVREQRRRNMIDAYNRQTNAAADLYWRKQAARADAEHRRLQPFCLPCAVLAVSLVLASLAAFAFIASHLPPL